MGRDKFDKAYKYFKKEYVKDNYQPDQVYKKLYEMVG